MDQQDEQQVDQRPEVPGLDEPAGPVDSPKPVSKRPRKKGRARSGQGKKRVPGRPFKPGQSGNPSGKPKPKPEPVYDEEQLPEPELKAGESEPSEVLRDFRWAYRNFGVRCRGTHQQMGLREMLESDRTKFMELLQKYEQMHKRGGGGGGVASGEAGVEAEADEGTLAALALIEKILGEARES